jgi:hypothetical protein
MQKKEYILGEGGGEELHGGALGPEVAVDILVLFLLPRGRPGDVARCVDVNHRPVGNPKRKV